MRKMKKVMAAMLAATMVMSMSFTALASDNQNATFTKTYKATKENTSSPKEKFKFSFEAYDITDSNKQLEVKDMPQIPDSEIVYDEGEAIVNAVAQNVSVSLSEVKWPGVGVYYYRVKEVDNKIAGVTYDGTTAFLKVTVAYDTGTNTYYTAFVTLNLGDNNQDGLTDSKTGGFINEYSAGSLKVTKQVTGNLGDIEQYFAINVIFTSPDGKTVNSDIYYTGGSGDYTVTGTAIDAGNEGWTGDRSTTIYLKHDDTITFTNIPAGVKYTVEEADYTNNATEPANKLGYNEASYVNSDSKETVNNKGTIDLTTVNEQITGVDEDVVTITNSKGVTVDTGITLDNMPYILILAVVALGAVGFVSKKRSSEF